MIMQNSGFNLRLLKILSGVVMPAGLGQQVTLGIPLL